MDDIKTKQVLVDKQLLVIKHYTNLNKNIFNYLADFFSNKFYIIIYKLSVQYGQKNNLSLEQNYLNILENYIESLIIRSTDEEEKKSKIISNFIRILYESYMKHINNQMIAMDDFLLKIVQSFLPNEHREEIYIKNKNNIAIIFHTIITNISELMVGFIKENLDLILHNRINENIILIKKDFIFIFCKVKENLELSFNKIDHEYEQDIDKDEVEVDCDETIKSSDVYKELCQKADSLIDENKKLKYLIKESMNKNNKLNNEMKQLKKLLLILNKKIKEKQIQIPKNDVDVNINTILTTPITNNVSVTNNDDVIIDEENPFSDLLENN
jgi:hypothetical protein